jgi:hypothetical protein
MNQLEKNMKRIGTKNISEQSNRPPRGAQMVPMDPGSSRQFVSTSQKQLQLLEELVKINRQMLVELQKMPKRTGS